MNDLERFFDQHTGPKIHKWRYYFEIYDRHFAMYRGTDVCIVEIGVSHGGSLQMWRDYFGERAQIVGVDVQPAVKKLESPGTRIMIGDQADPVFLESVAAATPRIDILIDDGGHTMHQQELTFKTLFPHVSETGIYLCEDLHTSYWQEYGGGYKRQGTFIELAKDLIDQLNAWHSRSPKLAASDFTRSAYSLTFYDSVLVIEKRPRERTTSEMRGVATIDFPSLSSPGVLNSTQLRAGRVKRITRGIPGLRRVARG